MHAPLLPLFEIIFLKEGLIIIVCWDMAFPCMKQPSKELGDSNASNTSHFFGPFNFYHIVT